MAATCKGKCDGLRANMDQEWKGAFPGGDFLYFVIIDSCAYKYPFKQSN